MPQAFFGSTIDDVYGFFKHHLRPESDNTARDPLTSFTFVAIDVDCINASPLECALCCDALDFNEAPDNVKLKTLRLPLEKALAFLCLLEQLRLTVSDVADQQAHAWSSIPPATVFQSLGKPLRKYRISTYAQARARRAWLLDLFANAENDRNYMISEDITYFKAGIDDPSRSAPRL